MNIQIITSSYPAYHGDPGGTAGLFVQTFAEELAALGHRVIVQPVARKTSYETGPGVVVDPLSWGGGDRELASMNVINPCHWPVFLHFFLNGKSHTAVVHKKYQTDRILCMWVIPCGLFGYWLNKATGVKYDVWALGSDIWKIKKIPLLGRHLIKKVVRRAAGVYADGIKLADDVTAISHRNCAFLPSSRKLPEPQNPLSPLKPDHVCHMLFVGRYHKNKGPDLLMRALSELPDHAKNKICVHMFGAGPLENKLKSLRDEFRLENSVKLNGAIDAQEFANYLKRVSFLIIPSRIESVPLVFSDALQVGTPVVSTPVGDLAHFIKSYRCGILAHDVSSKMLGLAIAEAIQTEKAAFAENVQKVSEMFKINNSVKQWLHASSAPSAGMSHDI